MEDLLKQPVTPNGINYDPGIQYEPGLIVRAENTTRDTITQALETLGTDKVLGIVFNDARQVSFVYLKFNYNYDYKPNTN